MRPQEIAHVVRNLIDVIPPSAGGDELLVQGQHIRGLAIPVTPVGQKRDRCIALLAKVRATPELEDGRAPLIA